MAERSYPFDGGPGAVVTETDWEAMASQWQDDGVADIPGSTSLSVVSEEIPGKVKVRLGRAVFRGFHYQLDADLEVNYSLNTDTSQWRADLVVIRLDRGTNMLSIAVKEGVPGGSAPNPDTGAVAPEMALAHFNVPPASAAVPAAQVFDRRPFVSRRIRVSATGQEPYPDGSIFYNTSQGRFFAKFRESGQANSEQSRIPKWREVVAYSASSSSQYPQDAFAGTLIWDEALQKLVVQTSASTPTWTEVGPHETTIKRRASDLSVAVSATTADTVLTAPIGSGAYTFEAVIFYRGTLNATWALRVAHPSLGTNGQISAAFWYNTSSIATNQAAAIIMNPQQSIGVPGTGPTYAARVTGSLRSLGGSSGNLAITYVTPSSALTVGIGSYLQVTKI
ncbi:hypothetical protein [Nonomuraea longicatena]|uniref:Minor tail protein n=1 Tax=Nonomuraea longicatena TaxID=83682 RepID=A0ABP4BXF6_9ACTN